MKTKTLLFLLLSITACNTPQKDEPIKTENLIGKQIHLSDEFLGKYLLGIVDNLCITNHSKDSQTLCSGYQLKNDSLLHLNNIVGKGQGATDLMSSFFAVSPNFVSFCDFSQNIKMIRIPKGKLHHLEEKDKEVITSVAQTTLMPSKYQNGYIWLDDENFLYIGANFGEKNTLSVSNITHHTTTPCNMWFDDSFKGEDYVKQMAYTTGANIYKHPSKNMFVYTCGYGKYIETFTLNAAYEVTNRKTIVDRKPLYKVADDGLNCKMIKAENSTSEGIEYVIPTEKYIYVMPLNLIFDEKSKFASYKGYSYTHNDTFEVYDWEGNHIKNVMLALPAYNLVWDSKNHLLYALTEKGEEEVLMQYSFEFR